MSTDPNTSVIEDVWIQVFALLLIVSGVFSLHYMLRPAQPAQQPVPALQGLSQAAQSRGVPLAAALPAAAPQEEPAAPVQQPAPAEAKPADKKTPGRLVVSADAGPGVNFTKLSEAITSASDGDTITLRPGKYETSVLTSKSLTITGGGSSPEDVELTYSVNPTFALDGGHMVMENLTIANTSQVDYWAVSVTRASLVLRNVNLKSTVKGLKVQDGDLDASDCDIDSTAGISVSGKSTVKLNGVSVTGRVIGISVEDSATDVQLDGSHISGGGGAGLRASNGAWVKINSTTISNNRYAGIMVGSGAEVRVAKSQITGNGECGAYVEENGKLVMEKVTLTRNKCGVGFAGAGSLEARNNKFADNSMGAIAVSPLEGDKALITGSGNAGLLVPGEKRPAAKKPAAKKAADASDDGSEE